LAATTKGVRYLFRMLIDSIVWGWKPSFTSTIRTARSAREPPLLRRDVKEWWPGVSMKRRPGIWKSPLKRGPHTSLMTAKGISVAPMCWVMAPASPSAMVVPLILSRRVVFPWSTWPMTQTMGVLRSDSGCPFPFFAFLDFCFMLDQIRTPFVPKAARPPPWQIGAVGRAPAHS